MLDKALTTGKLEMLQVVKATANGDESIGRQAESRQAVFQIAGRTKFTRRGTADHGRRTERGHHLGRQGIEVVFARAKKDYQLHIRLHDGRMQLSHRGGCSLRTRMSPPHLTTGTHICLKYSA